MPAVSRPAGCPEIAAVVRHVVADPPEGPNLQRRALVTVLRTTDRRTEMDARDPQLTREECFERMVWSDGNGLYTYC